MNLSLLTVIGAVILLVILYFFRRAPRSESPQPEPPPKSTDFDSSTYTFDPEEDGGLVPMVKRKVVVVAPDQTVRGAKHKLRVAAYPLGGDPDTAPPPDKRIEKFILTVINPQVMDDVTGDTVTEFSPPLKFTINFNSDDAAAARRSADGKPQLSIITFYRADDGWHWERLDTTLNSSPPYTEGTLTAEVSTLNPKDPVGMGCC